MVLGRSPADFLRFAPHFLVRLTSFVSPKNEGLTAKSRLAYVLKLSLRFSRRPLNHYSQNASQKGPMDSRIIPEKFGMIPIIGSVTLLDLKIAIFSTYGIK